MEDNKPETVLSSVFDDLIQKKPKYWISYPLYWLNNLGLILGAIIVASMFQKASRKIKFEREHDVTYTKHKGIFFDTESISYTKKKK